MFEDRVCIENRRSVDTPGSLTRQTDLGPNLQTRFGIGEGAFLARHDADHVMTSRVSRRQSFVKPGGSRREAALLFKMMVTAVSQTSNRATFS